MEIHMYVLFMLFIRRAWLLPILSNSLPSPTLSIHFTNSPLEDMQTEIFFMDWHQRELSYRYKPLKNKYHVWLSFRINRARLFTFLLRYSLRDYQCCSWMHSWRSLDCGFVVMGRPTSITSHDSGSLFNTAITQPIWFYYCDVIRAWSWPGFQFPRTWVTRNECRLYSSHLLVFKKNSSYLKNEPWWRGLLFLTSNTTTRQYFQSVRSRVDADWHLLYNTCWISSRHSNGTCNYLHINLEKGKVHESVEVKYLCVCLGYKRIVNTRG